MSLETPKPEELVKASLEASFYLSARDPGLTQQELVRVLVAAGVPQGEAEDTVRMATQRLEFETLPSGRVFFARDDHLQIAVFDFLIPFHDDPRDRRAVEHLHRWIQALAKQKGIRDTRIGRSDVVAEATEHGFRQRDVDFILEVMTRLRLLDREEDGEMYRATDRLLSWGIVGAQTEMRVPPRSRPAFSKVLPLVATAIEARSPEFQRSTLLDELSQVHVVRPNGDDARAV